MRFNGTVKTWNDDRGFGFIAPSQGDQEIFFHIKAYSGRGTRPEVGQPVLRHESSKASFRSAFWGTVVLNVVAFLVAFSPIGSRLLQA